MNEQIFMQALNWESFPSILGDEDSKKSLNPTLPETNIAHENPIFPCKYHQNGGFSMAMLVSGRVSQFFHGPSNCNLQLPGGAQKTQELRHLLEIHGILTRWAPWSYG